MPDRAPRPTSPRDLPDLPESIDPIAPPAGFLADAAAAGLEFEPGDLGALGRYLAYLLHANKAMNLTSIADPGEAWRRHILDSLTLLPLLAELPEGSRVIDVGSGGGLPGVPIAIAMPALRVTLLEATAKKAEFLRRVAARLGLANVDVEDRRAEVAAHDRGERDTSGRAGGHRERYDAVVARAVGRLPTLLELTVPFAKVGGRVLLVKGAQAEAEVAESTDAFHLLKAHFAGIFDTPTGRIVIVEKRSATPKAYPRRDGEPKRSPLGVGPGRA